MERRYCLKPVIVKLSSFNCLVLVLFCYASNVKTLFFVFAMIHFNKQYTAGYCIVIRTESDGLHPYDYFTTDTAKKCHNKIFFLKQIVKNPKGTTKVL